VIEIFGDWLMFDGERIADGLRDRESAPKGKGFNYDD
jgi:hypothetical protein